VSPLGACGGLRRNGADVEDAEMVEDRIDAAAERQYLQRRRKGKQPRGYTTEEFFTAWGKL